MIPKYLKELDYCGDVNSYIYLNVSKTFNFLNLNVLKNIFLKTVKDNLIWGELNKMFNSGILGFSIQFIYEKESIFNSSFLSIFLFEIYYLEFDNYFYLLSTQYNSVRSILVNKTLPLNAFYKFLYSLFPLKLEKVLLRSSCIANLNDHSSIKIFQTLLSLYSHRSRLVFSRRLNFVRYKDHIVVMINGSNDFAYLIFNKLFFFLRSSLSVDSVKSKVIPFGSDEMYFLGFKIVVSKVKKQYLTYNYKIKSLHYVLSRLKFIQKKLCTSFLKRTYSELITFFTKNSFDHTINLQTFSYKRFWINIFQFEVLRSFHLFELSSLSYDYFIPYSAVRSIKFISSNNLNNYSFNFYLLRSSKALSLSLSYYPSLIQNSFFSLDSNLYFSLTEVKKKLFFCYAIRPIDLGDFNSFSFSKFDFNNNVYKTKSKLSTFIDSRFSLKFFVPLSYLYSKFRTLGFIHVTKFRPIGNSKLLFSSDSYIIHYFGNFSYQLLIWYRTCYNFIKLKLIIECLRQSCILTLCRKHNKSKNWVIKVYTSRLLVFKNLFTVDSVFPSRLFVFYTKGNLNLERYDLCFFEEFFLEI